MRQLRALSSGVDVVVATPGRALDHLARGTLDLSGLKTVVLDEADEMLDMGFAEDIEAILRAAPADRQTVLFSATLPPRITGMVKTHLRKPVRVQIEREPTATGEAPRVRQVAYVVARAAQGHRAGPGARPGVPDGRDRVLPDQGRGRQLTETLNGRGYRAEPLHGGMSQEQRDKVMGRLRAGTADLLVATDVAARGLDIDSLTHVVNYDVPSAAEAYVHRIGRVGRAGREGVAITLAEPRERRMLSTIERVTGQRIPVEKLPSVADLQARRLELTRAALYELLIEDDLDRYRVVVETLTDEFDLLDVALAAVRLAHQSGTTVDDDAEIPEPEPRPVRPAVTGQPPTASRQDPGGKPARSPRKRSADHTKLFIGLGRAAGVRPQDLVGAITGESTLSGRDIGAIEIADRFSLVEVPEEAVDEVISALKSATIKGRRANVRRER